MSDTNVICSVCGKPHPRENIELTLWRPDAIHSLPMETRLQHCKESDDLCAIWGDSDETHRFFVRGVLPVPVDGRDVPFRIGAWAEVDNNAFYRIIDIWEEPNQSQEPPFPAVLANAVPLHQNTLGLRVQLQLTGPSSRPDIVIMDPSHALYHEQTHGITEHRAYEYTSFVT
jgi:hypothetical protein